MENEFNHPTVDSPSSPSDNRHSSGKSRSPQARSPFDSPAESSISSYQSSLSHGFSPREDHAPELPPAAAPVENRYVRNDHHSAGKSRSPPARYPPDSPAESLISSHQSSLSHGFSPREDHAPEPPPAAVPAANRYVRSEPKVVTKPDPGFGTVDEVGEGGKGRPSRPSVSILRRSKREAAVKKAALGFRAFGFVFCLISLSVMSADKNQGWALDSFYRYKEFRYSVSVNVIGFVYSGIQGIDLAYQLATGKYVFQHRLRYYLIFAIDQMLSYLLMSASSSAAIRVDDWESNWGKDKFPAMARASVGMSFMAFVAFAFSSLISGYSLYTLRSMQF